MAARSSGDENGGMRIRHSLRCALVLAGCIGVSAAALAATPPPSSSKKPPCALDAKERKETIRQEKQFLKRYPEEAAHRRAQLAALKPVVNGIRVGYKRYYELAAQRKPLDKERAAYENKPVPAWLQTKLDTSDAQFVGLTKVLRGHEQKIGEIQARYQCQRDTYGKLWAGAAPGSSACARPTCASP